MLQTSPRKHERNLAADRQTLNPKGEHTDEPNPGQQNEN